MDHSHGSMFMFPGSLLPRLVGGTGYGTTFELRIGQFVTRRAIKTLLFSQASYT